MSRSTRAGRSSACSRTPRKSVRNCAKNDRVSALVRQVETVTHFLHDRLVWVLMGAYFVAVVCPGPGLALRTLSLGTVHAKTASIELGAPTLLLDLLIFNAALDLSNGTEPDCEDDAACPVWSSVRWLVAASSTTRC